MKSYCAFLKLCDSLQCGLAGTEGEENEYSQFQFEGTPESFPNPQVTPIATATTIALLFFITSLSAVYISYKGSSSTILETYTKAHLIVSNCSEKNLELSLSTLTLSRFISITFMIGNTVRTVRTTVVLTFKLGRSGLI